MYYIPPKGIPVGSFPAIYIRGKNKNKKHFGDLPRMVWTKSIADKQDLQLMEVIKNKNWIITPKYLCIWTCRMLSMAHWVWNKQVKRNSIFVYSYMDETSLVLASWLGWRLGIKGPEFKPRWLLN